MNFNAVLIIFVIFLSIVAVSCGNDLKPPSDEGGFLKAMEQEFPGSNREHNLDTGKNVCFKLRSGMTEEEVVMEKFDHGMSITNAAMIYQLSTDYLCQEFKQAR